MKLDTYIRSNNLTYAKFANILGHDAKTIYRYAKGERMPLPAIMTSIYKATNGLVRPDDFHELPNLF
jgi:transcriptional regulator with XRE-family HTH domain